MTETPPNILISACLIGCNCRYDGRNQLRAEMIKLHEGGHAIAVCPEELGELGTPRPPCEKVGTQIFSIDGSDRTDAYIKGAQRALELAQQQQVTAAFLKSKSPMCGHKQIYDGTFSGKLTEGHGVFAELLIANGIKIFSVD
jgi:uncharacterized protein YbbK (DUF523 family)